MSGFLHKVEDAFHTHGHHHKDDTTNQAHSSTPGNQSADSKHDTHHHHHHNTRQNAQRRSQAEQDRADFMADRQYDRDVRSPQRGPGVGFEE